MNSKLIIPDLGVDAAEVVEIAVKVGDSIQAEQDILTLETDKASMEVPASVGGTISELTIAVGDSVTSGQVIGQVSGSTELPTGSAELYSAGSQGGTQSTDSHSAGEAKGKTGSTELPGSAELYSAREAKEKTQSTELPGSAELYSAGKEQGKTKSTESPGSAELYSAGEDKGRTGSAELYSAREDKGKTQSTPPHPPKKDKEPTEAPTAIPLELSAPETTAQLLIPDLGVDSAEVVEVAIKVGDSIEPEQEILTLETDKASMEVPANVGGTVQELSITVGDSVHSGQTIGLVLGAGLGAPSYTRPGSQGETAGSAELPGSAELYSAGEDKGKPREAETQERPPTTPQIYAGPAVRKLARELGVDLGQIQGSGTRGRIVKQDVQAHVKQRLQQPAAPSSAPAAATSLPENDFSQFGSIEVIAMSKVQRLTAAAMSSSLQVAPQVSHHDKADITALEQLRKDSKEFAAEHGVKLTALPLLIKACALALQQFPEFNSSLVGDNIIRKHYIHIGIAVDSPHGLFVPVIRDVDKKSVFAIAREAAELAAKAQSKTLKPADMQGGCFSISSLGALGGEYFTPIVNWPEAAILGVCQARMQPVHIAGEFSARLMLPLSLSYDHRLINGAAAARFTNYLIKLLAQPSFIMA